MALQILFLIVGLILILLGANSLVEGSSNLARRFGISEFMIGLTIVGMGTSAPEMVVSFMSAMKGSSDLAIGNIVGSNIFNTPDNWPYSTDLSSDHNQKQLQEGYSNEPRCYSNAPFARQDSW